MEQLGTNDAVFGQVLGELKEKRKPRACTAGGRGSHLKAVLSNSVQTMNSKYKGMPSSSCTLITPVTVACN